MAKATQITSRPASTAGSLSPMQSTGPMGPVSVSAAILLLVTAPLLRGGNREVALIVLEWLSIGFLFSVLLRLAVAAGAPGNRWRTAWRPGHRSERVLLAILLLSPAWLSLVYLTPLPANWWSNMPGRALYSQLMAGAAVPIGAHMPLSLVQSATTASLLAGIPLVAAFLAGYASRFSQLKLILAVVAGMAFLEVLFGLLQASGGSASPLYFTQEFAGRPFGTFGNTNHFANYVGMALVTYIWLAWQSNAKSDGSWSNNAPSRLSGTHMQVLWIAGGLVLALGVLMSFSRGAAASVLPAGAVAAGVALLATGTAKSWRTSALILGGLLLVVIALVGAGTLLSRFDLTKLSADASFRSLLASSTLAGAKEFWPWGAGWGTYADVYPKFQPVTIDGYAEHAHEDYAQLLFEGGAFALVLGCAFLWLATKRFVVLIRAGWGDTPLTETQMAASLCGIGLLGFMLHSFVEFNMHIPANAILAALLAGAYLRPLRTTGVPK